MTTIVHLVVALAIAAALSALLGLALSWRRPGDLPRDDGGMGLLPFFGVIVALVAWLGGAWLSAHDPAWAPRWLSALLAGSVAAFVLVALITGQQRWREPSGGVGMSGGAAALGRAVPGQVAPGLTALFWGLLVGVIALAALMWTIQVPA